MPDRKSSRSRKQVDYSKFSSVGDDVDDDDFADSTPPVSKKAKLSNKENKEKKKEKSLSKTLSKATERKSIEEKLYERELQAALELSLSQSDASQEPEPLPHLIDNSGTEVVIGESGDCPAPVLEKEDTSDCVIIPDDVAPPSPIVPVVENVIVSTKKRRSNSEDEIQVLEKDVDIKPSTSGRRTSKPKKYIDSDSDDKDSDFAANNISSEDDSDDDYNDDDDDSNFDGGGKKRKKNMTSTQKPVAAKVISKDNKKTPAPKTTKSASTKAVKSKSSAGAQSKSSPAVSVKHKPTTPGVPSRPSPVTAVRKSQNWTPPGRAGGDNSPLASSTSSSSHKTIGMHKSHSAGLNIKSPSSGGGAAMRSPCTGVGLQSPNGGLRIGLSRNMKLKPLHPNLKIQN